MVFELLPRLFFITENILLRFLLSSCIRKLFSFVFLRVTSYLLTLCRSDLAAAYSDLEGLALELGLPTLFQALNFRFRSFCACRTLRDGFLGRELYLGELESKTREAHFTSSLDTSDER